MVQFCSHYRKFAPLSTASVPLSTYWITRKRLTFFGQANRLNSSCKGHSSSILASMLASYLCTDHDFVTYADWVCCFHTFTCQNLHQNFKEAVNISAIDKNFSTTVRKLEPPVKRCTNCLIMDHNSFSFFFNNFTLLRGLLTAMLKFCHSLESFSTGESGSNKCRRASLNYRGVLPTKSGEHAKDSLRGSQRT